MLITWRHKAEAVANSTIDGSGSLWRPLRSSTFRNLLVADVVSDVGTFMQSVGAAWLMVSLNAGPMYVALTQTASALPFFILALPAGAIGDIVDRRKVILFTEIWMVVVAAVLAVMTIAGKMSPVLLLILTLCTIGGRRIRNTYLARRPARTGRKGRPPSCVSAQRHRIQLRPGSGTRAGWFRYRICGNWRGIPVEHLVLLRGYSCRSSLEAARC